MSYSKYCSTEETDHSGWRLTTHHKEHSLAALPSAGQEATEQDENLLGFFYCFNALLKFSSSVERLYETERLLQAQSGTARLLRC